MQQETALLYAATEMACTAVGGHCTLQEVLQTDTALPLISHN